MIFVIWLVAALVSSDNCLISSATTANPFPASPALAASMDAFKARRFVFSDISDILCVICSTSLIFCDRLFIDS